MTDTEDIAWNWFLYLVLAFGTAAALVAVINLFILTVEHGQTMSARLDCAKSGGRIEYSPEPHQSDWRCVMPVERGP